MLNFQLKEKPCIMMVSDRSIIIDIAGQKFTAAYDFLRPGTSLQDVDNDLFLLMLYVLFAGLEDVLLHETKLSLQQGLPIVSYSGGADSTAMLYVTGGIPIHITRSFDRGYETRQIKAVENLGAYQILTDFELIRTLYGKTMGFNVGMGYAAMFIPLLPIFQTDTIALGFVFDDIGFGYGKVFRHNVTPGDGENLNGSRRIMRVLKKHGINITGPIAGYSEVLTTRLASSSCIKRYSSCHTAGGVSACRACFKCFRKEALLGRPLDLRDPSLRKYIMKFLAKQPLKMASSTIYAIQYAGYSYSEFRRYTDIDVSFCERVNPVLFHELGGVLFPGLEMQTMEDFRAIEKFVERINDPKLYEF